MQYIVLKKKTDDVNLFADEDEELEDTTPITYEQYLQLMEYLEKKNKPAILPIQIAYFTGLRLGEVCGLTWQDINLEEQYLTVRRSIRYNGARHKTEIGPTKRKTECIMNCIIWMVQPIFLWIIRKSTLYVSDLTELMNLQTPLDLFAELSKQSSPDLRIFISTL